jgi:protein-tyrosine-phosphatase
MNAPYPRPEILLDQQLALKRAAARLQSEFEATFGIETIERFLRSSYDHYASGATVMNFLPLIAERFARVRLQACAKADGLAQYDKPAVLFLCTRNAGRSQMAKGFFDHYAADAATAWTGGTDPGTDVHATAVEAMREQGIDISDEFPKPWTDEVVRAADVVISMGCGDACPIFPGKLYEEWRLDDPAGLDITAIHPIRDDIERHILELLDELDIPIHH